MVEPVSGGVEDVSATLFTAACPCPPKQRAEADPAARVVSAPVTALVAAVDAVLAQQPAELPGPQALADTCVLLAQVERLRAGLLGRIADVEHRKLHVIDGASSTPVWVEAQQTSLDRGEVALARRMSSLPRLEQALRDGQLSIAVAERVAKALAGLRRHLDRPDGQIGGQDGEQALAGVIGHGVRSMICQGLGGLDDDDPRLPALLRDLAAIVLLPDELEDRAQDAHANRGFGLRLKDDGSGYLITDRDLDLECGELLQAVIDAELAIDPDSPADTQGFEQLRAQGWHSGEEQPAAAGPRSARQKRHDALRNGLRRYLNAGITGLRDKVAPRRHRRHRPAPGPARRTTGRLGHHRRPAPAQPDPPLELRQQHRPVRAQPRRQKPGGQPHRTDPQGPRTPSQEAGDRRQVPKPRLPTTRPDPAPRRSLGALRHNEPARHRAGLPALPPPPARREANPAPARRPMAQRERLDRRPKPAMSVARMASLHSASLHGVTELWEPKPLAWTAAFTVRGPAGLPSAAAQRSGSGSTPSRLGMRCRSKPAGSGSPCSRCSSRSEVGPMPSMRRNHLTRPPRRTTTRLPCPQAPRHPVAAKAIPARCAPERSAFS